MIQMPVLHFLHPFPTPEMVYQHQAYKQQLHMQPATPKTVSEPQPQTRTNRDYHHYRHKAVKLARHNRQTIDLLTCRLPFNEVHKNTWQIKNPCHPRHHKQNMKGFNPQYGHKKSPNY